MSISKISNRTVLRIVGDIEHPCTCKPEGNEFFLQQDADGVIFGPYGPDIATKLLDGTAPNMELI